MADAIVEQARAKLAELKSQRDAVLSLLDRS